MAKKGASADDIPYNANLRDYFSVACKSLSISQPGAITEALSPEGDAPITTIAIKEMVGEQSIVALCAALLGKGTKMTGHSTYKHLQNITMFKTGCGDGGAAAVAEVVKNGKALAVVSVSITDSEVGVPGCISFGDSLMLGANMSLQSLVLDLNPAIGDEGVEELCRGIRTNRFLKNLSLKYCNLGVASAHTLSATLAYPLPTLEILDLSGNTALGSAGLLILAKAAQGSMHLQELGMRDCGIGSAGEQPLPLHELVASAAVSSIAEDISNEGAHVFTGMNLASPSVTHAALTALGQALSLASCGLRRSTLEMNPLTTVEAEALLPFLGPAAGNTKCEAFRVDLSIRPPSLFAGLLRQPVAKKGKGKK